MSGVPPPLIPDLELENHPNEVEFTMCEKQALRNAWRIVENDKRKHALELSFSFYTDHPESMEKFRNESGALNSRTLIKHPQMVFDALEKLIFEGLESKGKMSGIISPITKNHLHKNVESEEIKLFSNSLKIYLKTVLQKVMEPTLEKSIDKVCQLIVLAHK